MASKNPWLVLISQSISESAPCMLYGVVDTEQRFVCVESTTQGKDLENVGFLSRHSQTGGVPIYSLSGAYSVGQIAVLDYDRFRSICRLHCRECLVQIMGKKFSFVRFASESIVSKEKCRSCLQKITRQRPSSTEGHFLLSHSYLYRVLQHRLRDGSSCFANLGLDFLCGLCVVLFIWRLMSSVVLTQIMGHFEAGSSSAVTLLQRLIVWLMGAPAGLKINRPLSWFLGQFYLYHVTLWHNYVSTFVVPHLRIFLSYFHFIGVFGLTVFLALLLDVLHIFLVHLSCFYIYACKLYRCQIRLLYSLGCLFRGKKWNPLRQRVDTAPFLADRVFVGVLIFSMTVFLLPTTALFYSVFTFVRIVILALQCILSRPISFLMSIPVAELLLWIVNDDKVRDQIEVDVFQSGEKQVFYKVIFQKKKLMRFYEENCYNVSNLFGECYDISVAIGRIFRGDVLYP